MKTIEVIEKMRKAGLFLPAIQKGIISGTVANNEEIYRVYLSHRETKNVSVSVRLTSIDCGCSERSVYEVRREMEG